MKILSKQKSSIIISTGIILSAVFLFYLFLKNSNSFALEQVKNNFVPPVVNAESLPQNKINSELPTRLRIPEINVDAYVENVGLTLDKAMDTPKDINNVAWYNLGPRPGDIGSAVIAGHYGWKDGKSSVFDNLYKLQIGDKIYIENEKGKVISFIVRKIQKYDSGADAFDVFSSSDGKEHLNLITCLGTWNKTLKSYSKRLVIFTDKTELTAL